jgi:hypothetical protein
VVDKTCDTPKNKPENKCIICTNEIINKFIYIPCGHTGVCEICKICQQNTTMCIKIIDPNEEQYI